MKMMLLALLLLTLPAMAEETLSSGLSQDYLQITSNFTGSELTVFGAVENPSDTGTRDIVVVVRGPDTLMTVRRKDRVVGIWINRARAKVWLPSYYFATGTRPLKEISDSDTLSRYEIGVNALRSETVASDGDPTAFVTALERVQQKNGLYIQHETGVDMQSATLFRVHVPIPTAVPRGSYNVEVYLFRDGQVISAQSTPFYVDQAGFERRLFEFAHNKPLSYGVATVLMGILLGWGSTFFFKRA